MFKPLAKVPPMLRQLVLISVLGFGVGAFTAPATVSAQCPQNVCEQDIIWDDCVFSQDVMYYCAIQSSGECWSRACSPDM